MSLHKKLVDAFGKVEPRRKEEFHLDIDGETDNHYVWKKVKFCIVFNASGELVDIERPPWRSGGKRRQGLLLVPQRKLSCLGSSSGFLWGHSSSALGIGKASVSRNIKRSQDNFNIFKAFHRFALDGSHAASIQAFQLFLERWNPDSTENFDQIAEIAGGSVVFRFRYEECFLHENHSARMIWARLLNSAGLGAASAAPTFEADLEPQI